MSIILTNLDCLPRPKRTGEHPGIQRHAPTKPDTGRVPPKLVRDLIAVHESAHAVVAYTLGLEPIALTFDRDGKGGKCHLATIDGASPTTIAAWCLAGLVGERIAYGAVYSRHAEGAADHAKAIETLSKICTDERAIETAMADTEKRVERILRERWRLVKKLAFEMQERNGLLAHDIERIVAVDRKLRKLEWEAERRATRRHAQQHKAGKGLSKAIPQQQFAFEETYRGVEIKAQSRAGLERAKRFHDWLGSERGGMMTMEGGWVR
jgi:hypothetical protein